MDASNKRVELTNHGEECESIVGRWLHEVLGMKLANKSFGKVAIEVGFKDGEPQYVNFADMVNHDFRRKKR